MAEAANRAANAHASEGQTTASAMTADASAAPPTTSAATLAAVLEIEPLVKLNISTRSELEAWILEQKNSLLLTKSNYEQQTQDDARQTQEAQRKRESLQQQQKALAASTTDLVVVGKRHFHADPNDVDEKNKKEPVLRELFLKNQEEDQKLKQLLHGNQIIVRFTQIDPEEPSRVFSFRIRIDPLTDRFLGKG
ncbi:hypothetical protein FI667_g10572, partial [Globisporangium splendens]